MYKQGQFILVIIIKICKDTRDLSYKMKRSEGKKLLKCDHSKYKYLKTTGSTVLEYLCGCRGVRDFFEDLTNDLRGSG